MGLEIKGNTVVSYHDHEERPDATVRVPEGVKKIGFRAFFTRHFAKVTLPESLSEIGEDAFRDSGLRRITVPPNVKELPDGVFRYCGLLTDVTLSPGLERIGSGAFACCRALEEVAIPETVREIGEQAFCDCIRLQRVVLPAGLSEIPELAFGGCQRLGSAVIPETVETVGAEAFCDCRSLKEIRLPAGLRRIGSRAFSETAFREVVLPETLAEAGEKPFSSATLLRVPSRRGLIAVLPHEVADDGEHDLQDLLDILRTDDLQQAGKRFLRMQSNYIRMAAAIAIGAVWCDSPDIRGNPAWRFLRHLSETVALPYIMAEETGMIRLLLESGAVDDGTLERLTETAVAEQKTEITALLLNEKHRRNGSGGDAPEMIL